MRKEYDDEDEIPERRHSSGKKKKKFGWVNVLTILLVVVLVVLVGVYAVINHYYSKSNYVSDDKITINKSTEVETESTGLTDEETDALQSEILNETQDIELPNNSNVYNILLIGVDRRDKTWYGNSDSMILLSVNKDTKQIHMTSFMRDLYANIPDVGVKKLNAACAYGGGPLVVRTIEDNYKLPIDNYASVDFDSMIDIIDAVGGIELSPSDDEVRVANNYINENVQASQCRCIRTSVYVKRRSARGRLSGGCICTNSLRRKLGLSENRAPERGIKQNDAGDEIFQRNRTERAGRYHSSECHP